MHLSQSLKQKYTSDDMSAREAQRLAEFIAWGPAVFQACRIMVKFGILEMLRDADSGLTLHDVAERSGLSCYAVKCLLEAALCAGVVYVDADAGRYRLAKAGWFLLNDPATKVNLDFNHYVNYQGWYKLEESLLNGKPEGLKYFGDWPTVYEGLSSLPDRVRQSWLAFDHFYSDSSFPEALEIVFRKNHTRSLYDIGGNTGKWALRCVDYDPEVRVTVFDLPQQIEMMHENIKGMNGAERITGYAINLLNRAAELPEADIAPDAIWMSQFLDCFSMDEIIAILTRARKAMGPHSRIYIMETLWDRQRFEPAAFCLTMTSLYFTAIANGNSKMYNTEDMSHCISSAGLQIEEIYDNLGQGHSILKVKRI